MYRYFIPLLVFLVPFSANLSAANWMSGANSVPYASEMLNYKLQPYDFLKVAVFQEDDLSTEIEIAADGFVYLPLIGKIKLGGLSIAEAQRAIAQRYIRDEFLLDPHVNIVVLKHVEHAIQVLGQVNEPGPVLIPASKKTMSLTEVISAAKGLNLRANASGILLTTLNANGVKQTEKVNFKKILKKPDVLDINVKEGDVIFVPESIF